MVTLPPRLVSTDFGTCSYQCFLSSCTPVSLHMLKCSCALTLSCLFIYCSFASIGHADRMWSIVSSNWWQNLHLLCVFCVQYCCCLVPLLRLHLITVSGEWCRREGIISYFKVASLNPSMETGWPHKGLLHCSSVKVNIKVHPTTGYEHQC
jgi:hypothetical protein